MGCNPFSPLFGQSKLELLFFGMFSQSMPTVGVFVYPKLAHTKLNLLLCGDAAVW